MVSIPLRVWVATCMRTILSLLLLEFQSPCGCELQLADVLVWYICKKFQSPCGCELQPDILFVGQECQRFNPLAGVSCNTQSRLTLIRRGVSIPLRVWVATLKAIVVANMTPFQSPCGCELQRRSSLVLVGLAGKFQSPCGCELQQEYR